ncbi:MAG TPA: endonuclease/exonuclease/phosphatase family protein [Bryobacteraceae bacterium]
MLRLPSYAVNALKATVLSLVAASSLHSQMISTPILDFQDLVALSKNEPLPPGLDVRLRRTLETPTVDNRATQSGLPTRQPAVEGVGPVLRVAEWNIEHGVNFDLIRKALSGFPEFTGAAADQAQNLREADVIVLNEVDLGVKRTDYTDIAEELARALGMNYVFGVEFVEVDRLLDLGVESVRLDDEELSEKMQDQLRPDPDRYRGLEGNVILSRYPIRNARILRLPVCHDWFANELKAASALERGKRIASKKVFLERIEREVRRGGRMALIADIAVPEIPSGSATVVSVHLENKCKPGCRAKQMDAVLASIRGAHHPVILGGDLNTSGSDGTPTSFRRELMERVKNYEFWTAQLLKWGTPASLPLLATAPVTYLKSYLDPTSVHMPVIASNKEARMFRHVENFRFEDGSAFDFRGDLERNLHGRERTLANSNQRAYKGFEPTFVLKRDFGGLVGRYKLDWFLVSPSIPEPRSANMSYRLAPHFPRTMRDLNNATPGGISDHAPITVDLPLNEPSSGSLR